MASLMPSHLLFRMSRSNQFNKITVVELSLKSGIVAPTGAPTNVGSHTVNFSPFNEI